MTQIQKDNIIQWLAALRSGVYKQGKKHLCLNDRYCCLGVACDVQNVEYTLDTSHQKIYTFNSCREFFVAFPDRQWFIDTFGFNFSSLGFGMNDDQTLSVLNDIRNYTFEQIADEIENKILNKSL